MKTVTMNFALALALAAAGALADDGRAFATGNMGDAVKAMDTDHDGGVSEAEFLRYQETQFDRMKNGAGVVADDAFATGNMSEAVKAMDADHDGRVSREEFLGYQRSRFAKMKKTAGGMVMDTDMLGYLRPGNP